MIEGETIGAIIIGRNEGDRLRSCLDSLPKAIDQVVYVDSGSTDGSIEVAWAAGGVGCGSPAHGGDHTDDRRDGAVFLFYEPAVAVRP